MVRPELEIVEKDDTHVIYCLWQDITGLNLYERAKVINQFLNKESKVMERVLENDLKDFLRKFGIIPQTMTESALNECFETLKEKNSKIIIIDRNENAYDERIVGVSPNKMTVIIEDEQIISIAMEIRVVDL